MWYARFRANSPFLISYMKSEQADTLFSVEDLTVTANFRIFLPIRTATQYSPGSVSTNSERPFSVCFLGDELFRVATLLLFVAMVKNHFRPIRNRFSRGVVGPAHVCDVGQDYRPADPVDGCPLRRLGDLRAKTCRKGDHQ